METYYFRKDVDQDRPERLVALADEGDERVVVAGGL